MPYAYALARIFFAQTAFEKNFRANSISIESFSPCGFHLINILSLSEIIRTHEMPPFEEEEEGTGVTSDVVKVKGEDPATPGPLP